MNLLLFTIVVVTACIVERVLHALCYSFLYIVGKTSNDERFKGIASINVSSGILNAIISIATAILSVFLQIIAIILQWIVTILALVFVSMILYIMFQYATDIMFEAGMTYNKSIGPSLQILLIWPLQIFTWFFEQICPVWNAFVWFAKKLPPQLLVETLTHNLHLVTMAVFEFGNTIAALAVSLVGWIQSFVCCDKSNSINCNDRCFEAGERIFDLLTPMSHTRNTVAYITQWLREMCYVLSGPMDLVTFPIMDINFAKGIHFVANSILYMVFHVPAMTVERCRQFGAEGPMMCVPDFDPVFNMMASGFRYLGLFMDNWLDVLILIVEGSLNRPSPPCDRIPDLLRNFDYKTNTFGANETLIVGMTEFLFARTDGTSVQYFSLDRDWQTIIHTNAFPIDVNTAFGVAAVSHLQDADHDPKGDDTTSLLGCSCAHTSLGVQITCGVAMFTDAVREQDRIVPVKFQLPSTGQVLQCNKIMIRVESVRWPVSRFTATRVQRTDGTYAQDVGCATKGTCLQVMKIHAMRIRSSNLDKMVSTFNSPSNDLSGFVSNNS